MTRSRMRASGLSVVSDVNRIPMIMAASSGIAATALQYARDKMLETAQRVHDERGLLPPTWPNSKPETATKKAWKGAPDPERPYYEFGYLRDHGLTAGVHRDAMGWAATLQYSGHMHPWQRGNGSRLTYEDLGAIHEPRFMWLGRTAQVLSGQRNEIFAGTIGLFLAGLKPLLMSRAQAIAESKTMFSRAMRGEASKWNIKFLGDVDPNKLSKGQQRALQRDVRGQFERDGSALAKNYFDNPTPKNYKAMQTHFSDLTYRKQYFSERGSRAFMPKGSAEGRVKGGKRGYAAMMRTRISKTRATTGLGPKQKLNKKAVEGLQKKSTKTKTRKKPSEKDMERVDKTGLGGARVSTGIKEQKAKKDDKKAAFEARMRKLRGEE